MKKVAKIDFVMLDDLKIVELGDYAVEKNFTLKCMYAYSSCK